MSESVDYAKDLEHGLTNKSTLEYNSTNFALKMVTTKWGRLILWAIFGCCSRWPYNAILTVVEKYMKRSNNHEIPWSDCANAIIDAISRTIGFTLFGAALNAAIVDNNVGKGKLTGDGKMTTIEILLLSTVLLLSFWSVIASHS